MNPGALHAIEAAHIAKLRQIAKRLFTENRMTADEMRDAAQALTAIAEYAEQMEVPL